MPRKPSCEICGDPAVTVVDLTCRQVHLCRAHAGAAQAGSLDELRKLFVEPEGRRALLSRRAADERRMFPPRPEGRRHDDGRRDSDRRTLLSSKG